MYGTNEQAFLQRDSEGPQNESAKGTLRLQKRLCTEDTRNMDHPSGQVADVKWSWMKR